MGRGKGKVFKGRLVFSAKDLIPKKRQKKKKVEYSEDLVVHRKKNRWLSLFTFTFLTIFVLGTFGILVLEKVIDTEEPDDQEEIENGEKPPLSPTIEPTADWKTYTSNDYGFLVRYPNEHEFIESTIGEDFIVTFNYEDSEFYGGHQSGISIRAIGEVGPVWADVRDYFSREYFSKEVGKEYIGMKSKTKVLKKGNFRGYDSVKVEESSVDQASADSYYAISNYIYKDDYLYKISLFSKNKDSAQENMETYNQMVSSFVFTGLWKTYNNEEHDYTIRYPSAWFITEPECSECSLLLSTLPKDRMFNDNSLENLTIGIFVASTDGQKLGYWRGVEVDSEDSIILSSSGGIRRIERRNDFVGLGEDALFETIYIEKEDITYVVYNYPAETDLIQTRNSILTTFEIFESRIPDVSE